MPALARCSGVPVAALQHGTRVQTMTRAAGARLTCPMHVWAFDIETGRCLDKGDRPLTEFPHRIEKRRLLAHW